MSLFDRDVLAERSMAVDRHLRRVADRLPTTPGELQPSTDASDAVVLHLWQATQMVIDLAMAACLSMKLGTPSSYANAFQLLQKSELIDGGLADRLVRDAYETLDMRRVHEAATRGPANQRAFLQALSRRAESPDDKPGR
jgi:uncharacterized protein YutE (UPF0331/DUF86 family)